MKTLEELAFGTAACLETMTSQVETTSKGGANAKGKKGVPSATIENRSSFDRMKALAEGGLLLRDGQFVTFKDWANLRKLVA